MPVSFSISTTSPVTHLYPRVCVTWGDRDIDGNGCPLSSGERHEYVLGDTYDGRLASGHTAQSGSAAWVGRCEPPAPVGAVPREIKAAALKALARERGRRQDGQTYVARFVA